MKKALLPSFVASSKKQSRKNILFSLLGILLLGLPATSQIPNYVPSSGLVGWWPFNGNANDESGNGNNGTVNGAILTYDRDNQTNKSYYFNGSSNIFVSNNNSLSFTSGQITLSTWIYMPNVSYGNRIISKDKNDKTNRDFTLKITSSGLAQFTAFTSGDNAVTIFSNQQLQSGNWVHLVVTKSQSIMKLFINGEIDNSINANTLIAFTSANLFFGKTSENWTEYFNGNLDDIGIWNRSLTDQEVKNLYNASKPPATCLPSYVPTNGLVGWWPFCGNANDESGNNLNGNVIGANLTIDRLGNANSAYNFNVSNWSWGSGGDRIYIPFNSKMNVSNITVSAWFRRNTNGTSNQWMTVLNRFQYGYNNPNGQTWGMTLDQNSSFLMNTWLLQAAPNNSQISLGNVGPFVELNLWYNVTFTFDGVSLKQYVNGILTDTDVLTGFTLNTNGNSGISIGVSDQANGQWGPFGGQIDDIGFWNRALTEQEVKALYSGCPNPPSVSITAQNNTTFCQGGFVKLTANQVPGYTYKWLKNGTAIPGATDTTYTASESGSYSVQITDGTCSANSNALNVTVTPYPSDAVTASGPLTFCPGGSVTLTAQGTGNYLWSNGATTQSIVVNQSGDYFVTVTSNGCSITSPVQVVSLKSNPTVSISGPSSVCSSSPVTLVASGANTYQWNTGATSASVSVTPNQTTTYSVTGTNADGCKATISQTITVNSIPAASISGPAGICPGQSVTLTAAGGVSYLWSNGATTASISVSPTQTTTYSVTVTGSNGCTAQGSKIVTLYSNPTANITGPTGICSGQSTTLTATGGATYSWNTGATTSAITVSPTTATNYSVTITNANGCTTSATKSLLVYSKPTPIINGPASVCIGSSATLTASGGNTYQWNMGSTSATINVSPTQTTNYSVIATNADGCTATANKTLTVDPIPTASISGPSVACIGKAMTLTANGGTSYLWNNGATSSSITVFPSQNTTYSVTVSNGSGCSANAFKQVTVNPVPAAPFATSNSPVNPGDPIFLFASAIPGATYQWVGPALFNSNQQNPVIPSASSANAGTYLVSVTINGCTSADASVKVTVNQPTGVLTLLMDTVQGSTGSDVLIRVKVKGFKDIMSTQGSIQFNPAVIQYVSTEQYGLTGLSFGTNQASSGLLSFSWSDANLLGKSLADNSVFFAIRFKVLGSNGSSSALTFVNSPTNIEFIDDNLNNLTAQLFPGLVQVLSNVQVSGRIKTETGDGVRSATVQAIGLPNYSMTTGLSGNYAFTLPGGSNYSIKPSKSNDTLKANGISSLDILLIQRHILGVKPLASPYKIIAADVDNSSTVSTQDINLITDLILGNNNSFPNNRLWEFVPSNHSFANPANPFPYPSSLSLNPVTAQTGQDFTGMRLGDVNNSYLPTVARIAEADTARFIIPERAVKPDSTVSFPVVAGKLKNVAALQFTLQWDPQILSLEGTAGDLINPQFGYSRKDEGLLSVIWFDNTATNPLTAESGANLFQLFFKGIGKDGSQSKVEFASTMTPIEAIDNDLNPMLVRATTGSVKISSVASIGDQRSSPAPTISIAPNPFAGYTQLSIESTTPENCLISIYDLSGKLISRQQMNTIQGKNTLQIGHELATGTYLLSVQSNERVQTLRMVVMK